MRKRKFKKINGQFALVHTNPGADQVADQVKTSDSTNVMCCILRR